mgnify:CR=1 FL=1
MTDAPATSAEVEKALECADDCPGYLADEYLALIYGDLPTHVITLAKALTAERKRVKALEAAIRGLVNRWNAKIAEINRAKQP